MNKLYETNSYLKECKSVITSLTEKDGEYYVTLSDTIFFPEEGGQYADTGYLIYNGEKVRVIDGIFGPEISYKIERAIPEGTEVTCELNFDVRFDRMQNHSGEHLLTGVIHNKYGLNNVGFHLSDEGPVTLDLNGQLSYEQVIEMENVANKLIYANLPITDSYPTKEELTNIEYRSKIEIDGQVRLITIGDENEIIDICACCAPHVRSTGEIGIVKVLSTINWKGGIRISMLAGRRALEYIDNEHNLVRELTSILTTSPENISGLVKSHIEEINLLKGKLAHAMEENVLQKIAACENSNKKNEQENVNKDCFEFVDKDVTAASMKNIYNVLSARYEGYVGIFAGDDESGYRYFAGSSKTDSRELGNMLKETLNAKGGGTDKMVQGQIFASRCEIENMITKWRA